jgi:DNA-binding NarL/FixJ family response regulator
MTNRRNWVLLVEDDPIFSLLFCRSWKTAFPHVPILVADSLVAMSQALDQASSPPSLLVMDRTLPDGNGHEAAATLQIPSHCWSALGEGGTSPKPQGKPALEASVQILGRLIGA